MKLNVNEWKEFNFDYLFDIIPGKYHSSSEYENGQTPYLSASNENNGVADKINITPEFTGNCITTGKVGCTAFYQPKDFCATSDVNILKPKFECNEQIGLFITTVINKSENYKWSYGRQCRVGDSKNIAIKLPIEYELNNDGSFKFDNKNNKIPKIDSTYKYSKEGYIPDFKFMEDYIKSLNSKPITTSSGGINHIPLVVDDWKEFILADLFDEIYKATPHIKNDIQTINNPNDKTIRFVTRTDKNNGCDCYVNSCDFKEIENENVLIIGDTTATCFYQNDKFITGDHIVILKAKWLDQYTGLFIKTILEKERYKYNYGRAFKMELIKKTIIKLPVNETNMPDWDFIRKYIKSLPYGDKI